MTYAPVVIFCYNRPYHLRQTVEQLLKNQESSKTDIFFYCDGSKNDSDYNEVYSVRKYAQTIKGFKSKVIVEREKNFGLANNIIQGISEVLKNYKDIIVLEDDLVTSKYFLNYMNTALDIYKNENSIASIHGYIYPTQASLPDSFFLKGADCWGWATWKRAWDEFNHDGKKLLKQIKEQNKSHEFDFYGSYPYTKMLEDWVTGKNNSWAIRWYASCFLKDMLTLYPGKTLVKNIGLDGSGTHCQPDNIDSSLPSEKKILLRKLPLKEDLAAKMKVCSAIKKQNTQGIYQRIMPKYKMSKKNVKKIIKGFTPPIFSGLYRKYFINSNYSSDYQTWEEGEKHVSGYNSMSILDSIKDSAILVKNGVAPYERDGVVFKEIQYSWPLLSGLMLAAAKTGQLSVLDFGGSLGTTYFQNKKFLDSIKKVTWSVVEQKNFVAEGNREFANEQLKFYDNISSCITNESPNVLLISSSLQYISDYYGLLTELLSKHLFEFVIIDRTPFSRDDAEHIMVQNVDPSIYKGSYVCRSLSKSKLDREITSFGYDLMESFESLSCNDIFEEKGMIFKHSSFCEV